MNVLDAKVIAVSAPAWLEHYQKWSIEIRYSCWGSESTTARWFDTKEEAESVKEGDIVYV